jgi:hypothetical protein
MLARRVATIVGDKDERVDDGAEILSRLRRLGRRLLGRPLSADEGDVLRSLALIKPKRASVITRVLVAWRHGVGERDVRRIMRTLNVALDKAGDVVTGQPFLHADGRQLLDEKGQPAQHKPRSRVKLIYR